MGSKVTPLQQQALDFLDSPTFFLILGLETWVLLTQEGWTTDWCRPYMVSTGEIAVSLVGAPDVVRARVRLAVGLP